MMSLGHHSTRCMSSRQDVMMLHGITMVTVLLYVRWGHSDPLQFQLTSEVTPRFQLTSETKVVWQKLTIVGGYVKF